MNMTVERLGGSFAARVSGIDAGNLTNAQAADLHQAYLDHKVLVIEGQEMSVAQFDAFGQLF
ncbi:MAG: TauD/TfdA family dioxygenase, partial [Alphaproteobacteria bacterium]